MIDNMTSLINDLSVKWDLWIGQYRAFFPTEEEDLEACLQLMEKAGGKNRKGSDYLPNFSSQIAACQDTRNGEVIAALCLADAHQLRGDACWTDNFRLDLFHEQQLPHMAVFVDMVIEEEYQKTPAAAVLISHCFIEILKAGGQAILLSCEAEHFSIFKRLGLRPIGLRQKNANGVEIIPMICFPDEAYFSTIHSPVISLLRGLDFITYQGFQDWYEQLIEGNANLRIGSDYYPDNEEQFTGHSNITEGLSSQGKKAFLKNASVIKYQEEEVLLMENDGGKAFGFVRQGILKVMINGKPIVLLGEGDIFGEIAFVLDSNRSAQVVAASPNTEVVLFSETALNRLESEADRTIIWRNLSRVIAQKLMLTNKLLD
ncbi:MAG: cyclic nucleotide-binding domain-containing protein [Saprospiraceae bacterium]